VGGEQEYDRKPEPEVVLAAILAKKTNFLVFLGAISARCYGPRRSIFGLVSSFVEHSDLAKKLNF